MQECLDAVDECGAPMVAIPGGEPLIHKEIGEIVKGIVARKKFVSLCTNALLLEKKLDLFEPSPYLFFSVHLDGIKEHHDKSVCMEGGFEKAIAGIKAAKAKGFTVNVNATIFDGHPAEGHRGVPRPHQGDRRRRLDLARLRLRARARPGALPQPPQDQGAVPQGLRHGQGQEVEFHATPACSSTSSPATRPITARPGACRRATSSAGRSRATCWARATPRPSTS